MKVFVQRITDGFFLNACDEWVEVKEEALHFSSCRLAGDYCLEQGLTEVRLWLSFDKPNYDFPIEVSRIETRGLAERNGELKEKARALMAQIDQIVAEIKELKKQFPFKRGPSRDEF